MIYVLSKGQTHELGMVTVTSTGKLIDNGQFHLYAASPAWSPDGMTIAFFGENAIKSLGGPYKNEGAWAIGVDGGKPRLLYGTDYVHNIAWSPDGKSLAFEASTRSDATLPPPHTIIVTNADGQAGNKWASFDGEQPAWKDSQTLVYKAYDPKPGLWEKRLGDNSEQQLTDDGNASFPAISPDGKYMAYSSDRQDGDWEIYLLDLNTKATKRLTNHPGIDTTPVFSRDSKAIYWRINDAGEWLIKVMTLDGKNSWSVRSGIGESEDWGMARPAVY